MIITILGIIVVVVAIPVFLSYNCTITVEYRNMVHTVTFNDTDEQFGTITVGKEYKMWRNAFYNQWKRKEVFHLLDDNGVNRYIDIYDDALDKCEFKSAKPI